MEAGRAGAVPQMSLSAAVGSSLLRRARHQGSGTAQGFEVGAFGGACWAARTALRSTPTASPGLPIAVAKRVAKVLQVLEELVQKRGADQGAELLGYDLQLQAP